MHKQIKLKHIIQSSLVNLLTLLLTNIGGGLSGTRGNIRFRFYYVHTIYRIWKMLFYLLFIMVETTTMFSVT